MSALRIFVHIEGTQRAAAAAHFAFFSLFAAIIVCVAIASLFFDGDRASRDVIAFLSAYVPVGATARDYVVRTLSAVVEGRRTAGTLAFALLVWSVMRFIAALVRAVNRAWSAPPQPWWRVSLKSLLFVLVMIVVVPISMALPVILVPLRTWLLPDTTLPVWFYESGSVIAHVAVLFLALGLLYRLAPRRHTRFAEVWTAAAVVTVLQIGAEIAFGLYLRNFASLNAIYGAFGALVALLMWIYFSCTLFIYGACLCAARSQSAESRAP